MSRLVFVTGGARSGKSDFSMRLAEDSGLAPLYIATATAGDPEMAERIGRHRDARGGAWTTLEEPLDLVGAISGLSGKGHAAVVDCLTLWLTNMMTFSGDGFEDTARVEAGRLAAALRSFDGVSVVVSNEVGLGIVPDNALARRFRDAAGAANRVIAEAADEVYLVVSGIPVRIK
ncbi:MAG: bifunctional adenosylcobinamide kinase/adenosylcobinamide-phosphate guanylyltransferase [Nitrospirae bacterium]|nr:bifunctional adenosylcobinamide kinase/adenosylcobinamide-phosphate guanylyltransferase [Nitrospirota bacterium]